MSQTTLTPAERDCCDCLSYMFLDTQLDPTLYDVIARDLHRSDLTLAEIHHLFWYDVYPVLIWNLVQIAGEWTG